MSVSDGPQNLVEHAADAAIQAVEMYLDDRYPGAKIDQLLVLLKIEGGPGGEENSVVAGQNVKDAKDLVALLATHFMGAAEQVGLNVTLIPITAPPEDN